jgi:hypothetical protein
MGEITLSSMPPPRQELSPVLEHQISQARILIARLERLSADSYWAHQASGLRGALLRSIALCESQHVTESDQESETSPAAQLDHLMEKSFEILVRGAREMHR